MLFFSDGSFGLIARMPFHGHSGVSQLLKVSSSFRWKFLGVSNCKSFPEVFLGRYFAIFTIATVTFYSVCFFFCG